MQCLQHSALTIKFTFLLQYNLTTSLSYSIPNFQVSEVKEPQLFVSVGLSRIFPVFPLHC